MIYRRCCGKTKPNEIPSPRFWASTLQKLYSERHESIPLNSDIQKVYSSFKTIKIYRFPSQNAFGLIRYLPDHMLCTIHSKAPHLKNHLDTSVVFNPTQPALASNNTTLEKNKHVSSKGREKHIAKQKVSPRKSILEREPELVNPLKRIHKSSFNLTLGHRLPHPATLPKYPLKLQNHLHTA